MACVSGAGALSYYSHSAGPPPAAPSPQGAGGAVPLGAENSEPLQTKKQLHWSQKSIGDRDVWALRPGNMSVY
jgi:hypothetical protein